MDKSFRDFDAPRKFDFVKRRPQILHQSKFHRYEENFKFFDTSNQRPQNQPHQNNPMNVSVLGESSKQAKEALQNKTDSKKDIAKALTLVNEKNLNPEKIQEILPLFKEPRMNLEANGAKGHTIEKSLIMTSKEERETKPNLPVNKPPSVNRPVEVIKQESVAFKPPSVNSKQLEEKKPDPQMIKKESMIESKQKILDIKQSIDNFISMKQSGVRKVADIQVPPRPNNLMPSNNFQSSAFIQQNINDFRNNHPSINIPPAKNVNPKATSNPVQSANVFAPKQSNLIQSTNIFAPKQPNLVQSTNVFAPKQSNTIHSTNVFAPKQPNQVQSTNFFAQKQPEKPHVPNFPAPVPPNNINPQSTNLFARRLEEDSRPVNHVTSQSNFFTKRLQENQGIQTKPKLDNNVSSISNSSFGTNGMTNNAFKPPNFPAGVSTFGTRSFDSHNPSKPAFSTGVVSQFGQREGDTKPKDSYPQNVNRQTINAMGHIGNYKPSVGPNFSGFNSFVNPFVNQNNQRSVSNPSNQMGSIFAPNNNRPAQGGQMNRTVSAPSIAPSMPMNQNTAPKRVKTCLFPIRIQRQWEEAHGKKWYQLKSSEIPAAEESMRKRMNRQPGSKYAQWKKPANTNQNNQRKSYNNPNNTSTNRGGGKPIFRF